MNEFDIEKISVHSLAQERNIPAKVISLAASKMDICVELGIEPMDVRVVLELSEKIMKAQLIKRKRAIFV